MSSERDGHNVRQLFWPLACAPVLLLLAIYFVRPYYPVAERLDFVLFAMGALVLVGLISNIHIIKRRRPKSESPLPAAIGLLLFVINCLIIGFSLVMVWFSATFTMPPMPG